jgi:hypothetical protein
VSETNCCLSYKVVIEMFYLLWFPELRWEHVLVTISDTASSMLIKSPLIELSILSNCSNVILIDIYIYEFDYICIISCSSKDRLSLNIFSTSECSLAIETSRPQLIHTKVFDDYKCHNTITSGNLDSLDTLSKVNLLKLVEISNVHLSEHAISRTEQ